MTDGIWHDLITVKKLEAGDATPVTHEGREYAVYDTNEGVTVSENRCTHAGASLCDGYFNGTQIECPLHQGLFDARSGKAIAAPVTRDLIMFPTRILEGMVQIRY